MKKENNIFDFATKELSQDALLCWLINFINHKNNVELYKKAKKLLNHILECKMPNINIEDYTVEIKQQFNFIDIFIVLKDNQGKEKYAIIIEDKKLTTVHNNQIENYKIKIKNIYKSLDENNIITVYYKPYIELDNIQADVVIDRAYMKKNIFNQTINNQIYMDYKNFLGEIDEKYKDFYLAPIKNGDKIMLYKFANEYNKIQKDENKKMKVVQVRGSTYIDWYHNGKSEYKESFSDIYLSININYQIYELRVRGKTNNCSKNVRNELEEVIERKCIDEGIQIQKFRHGKMNCNSNIMLIKISLNENYIYKDMFSIIEKMEKVISQTI